MNLFFVLLQKINWRIQIFIVAFIKLNKKIGNRVENEINSYDVDAIETQFFLLLNLYQYIFWEIII